MRGGPMSIDAPCFEPACAECVRLNAWIRRLKQERQLYPIWDDYVAHVVKDIPSDGVRLNRRRWLQRHFEHNAEKRVAMATQVVAFLTAHHEPLPDGAADARPKYNPDSD